MKKDLYRLLVLIIIVSITCPALRAWFNSSDTVIIEASYKPISPTATVTPTPRVYSNDIEAYIYEVFGDYGDSAIRLLKGTKECGGENPGLNPEAVYTNTTGSRDRGIFQINDVFHPYMTDEKAFNYKENIKYAWRMFKNDNYTFRRWTAGRCMGI